MTTLAKAKIYTKTGDQGKTRLVGGSCVEKFNPRVEAYGTVDELNSYLGIVRAHLVNNAPTKSLDHHFERIQNELFNLGSLIACEKTELYEKLPSLKEEHILLLEAEIDQMSSELEDLKNFILPAGQEVSAHLHYARTLCRRAERKTAEMESTNAPMLVAMKYLNRLSDYLFVTARYCNHLLKTKDVLWQQKL